MNIKVLVLAFTLMYPLSEALADTDWCYEYARWKDHDKTIEACTNGINSGKYSGRGLVIAYNNRGNAYKGKGDDDGALSDYSNAIDLDSKYAYAYNGRGNAYADKGDFSRAIGDYTKVIELDSKHADSNEYQAAKAALLDMKGK